MDWAIEILFALLFLGLLLWVPARIASRKGRSARTAVLLTILCWPVGLLWAIFCRRGDGR